MKCEILAESVYGVFEGNLMRARKMVPGDILEGPEWYISALIGDGLARLACERPSGPESAQIADETCQNAPQNAPERNDDHPFIEAGIKFAVVLALVEAGFHTWDAVAQASDDDLLDVDGIGPATLRRLRDWLKRGDG